MSVSIHQRLSKLFEAQLDLAEADSLVDISHRQFQEKLNSIEQRFEKTNSVQEQSLLCEEAKKLYQEYANSLEIIESFVDKSVKNTVQTIQTL